MPILRFALDTNLCIRVIRDRPQRLLPKFNAEAGAMAISTIVLTELLRAAAKSARPSANRHEVERFCSRLQVLLFDEEAAGHAADIWADLARKGQQIGSYDVLIAGQARSKGLVVVTGNLAEFGRVDGLRCEDWLADPATSA